MLFSTMFHRTSRSCWTRLTSNIRKIPEAAALAALNDQEHVRTSKAKNDQERSFLETELAGIGVPFVPSVTNFMLLTVSNHEAFCNSLRQCGILVRLGKNGVRVTLGTHEENLLFLEALKDLKNHR